MTQRRNEMFKVRTGTVDDAVKVLQEPGGLMINELDGGLYYGDGYNIVKVTPEGDLVAVKSIPIEHALTADTEVEDVDWYDSVLYNYGSNFVATSDSILTIGTTGDYRLSLFVAMYASVKDVNVSFRLMLDSVEILSKDRLIKQAATQYISDSFVEVAAIATNPITVDIEADKTCDVTFITRLGMMLLP